VAVPRAVVSRAGAAGVVVTGAPTSASHMPSPSGGSPYPVAGGPYPQGAGDSTRWWLMTMGVVLLPAVLAALPFRHVRRRH
jgi:hypothetical protein